MLLFLLFIKIAFCFSYKLTWNINYIHEYIVAVLTKQRMLKKKRKNIYFLIVESGFCICICENPGLLNQSYTEVKAILSHPSTTRMPRTMTKIISGAFTKHRYNVNSFANYVLTV